MKDQGAFEDWKISWRLGWLMHRRSSFVKLVLLGWLWVASSSLPVAAGPVIGAGDKLREFDFWVNRDFEWFEENIPLLDSPDRELDRTYYYRWELVTRHLVYASPGTGYVFTEFANRPFWSGAYGTIACPAGMQIDDVRWLANPRYVRDYMRFWMRHPGAQPAQLFLLGG